MKNKVLSSLAMSACFYILSPFSSAYGQEDQQCSLDQIAQALNQLNCQVVGTFISSEALVTTIATTCEPTTTAEMCHNCFRRSEGKAIPAVRGLIKIKMLPRDTLYTFRMDLLEAEIATCASKQEPEWEDPDGEAPVLNQPGRHRGRGRR